MRAADVGGQGGTSRAPGKVSTARASLRVGIAAELGACVQQGLGRAQGTQNTAGEAQEPNWSGHWPTEAFPC